ncbi:MAG: ABC transporter ATP-binding protein [Candidatus Omnitrophica bacterium]|nr:ABC transporter ATP-binding protein [Candidatus Omnitrophota bacterium]MBU4473298.1 ABC transporter ATP-binding protein [Candidatus Omnitrophota bacterium]MCG2706593.1 ABC transporter ATP-binding protein [Candidatus Omnitrophota bacterium]
MDTLIKIDSLCGGYGKETVIKDVSLEIKRSDFLGIIGPNGSGKSTLLKLMSRVLTPIKGKVTLEEKDIAKMDLKEFCQRVAFVPQDTLISFSFNVWEIVLMGRIPHLRRLQLETKKDFSIAEYALSLTDTLYLKERQIDTLSAGERQRVIMAKALTQQPGLLFLDEPTSHLDIGHQIQILDLLRRLNREKNLTIVMVIHDLNLASEYCNRTVLLNEGKIFKEGTPSEVLTYQNIEAVYKTVVVVSNNPITSKPYIILVSGVK